MAGDRISAKVYYAIQVRAEVSGPLSLPRSNLSCRMPDYGPH